MNLLHMFHQGPVFTRLMPLSQMDLICQDKYFCNRGNQKGSYLFDFLLLTSNFPEGETFMY